MHRPRTFKIIIAFIRILNIFQVFFVIASINYKLITLWIHQRSCVFIQFIVRNNQAPFSRPSICTKFSYYPCSFWRNKHWAFFTIIGMEILSFQSRLFHHISQQHKDLRMINQDAEDNATWKFLEHLGLRVYLSQYEMELIFWQGSQWKLFVVIGKYIVIK